MKISQQWLRELVPYNTETLNPEKLSALLTSLGLEVESVEDRAAALRGFVVGRVLEKEKHPKADKLSVCTVDVGDGAPRTIVCGAPNVEAGQTVPVALVGAKVPAADFVIAERALRGIVSQGMICSKAELGLGDEADGIWVMDTAAKVGTPLAAALGLEDVVFDVAITPNRADCLSHIGIAREVIAAKVSAVTSLHDPPVAADAFMNAPGLAVPVEIENAALCTHYIAQVVTGVTAKESPQWLKDRLTAVGLRPRNVIVDVTNFVNMELGQPLHAFDADKLRNGNIVVRTPRSTETQFTTLDGKQRALAPHMLMICDGQGPIAVAGVMGGENTEVDESTTSVVIESAFFNPQSVRRTAKVLGISSDASYRFERGVDPGGIRRAADRALYLLMELAGGKAGPRTEVGTPPDRREPIPFSGRRICSLLGVQLSDDQIVSMLESVGCVLATDAAVTLPYTHAAVPPSWRADISIEADLAEEVMRLYGIDNIPANGRAVLAMNADRLPDGLRAGGKHGTKLRETIRTMLVARGYYDCVTHVLTKPDEPGVAGVRLKNALGVDFSAMRGSVIPSLLEVASRNLRYGQQTVRLMEIGSRFELDATAEFGIRQREGLTLVITGQTDPHWGDKPRSLDIYDLVGELHVLYPRLESIPLGTSDAMFTENRVELRIGGVVVGTAGEVRPEVTALYDIERPVAAAVINVRAVPVQRRTYAKVGQYPAVRRDLALIVGDDVPAGRVIDVVRTASPLILRDVGVFDVYRGENVGKGQKSIGIGMIFRSDERTLVDAEVDDAIAKIITATKDVLSASIRGATNG